MQFINTGVNKLNNEIMSEIDIAAATGIDIQPVDPTAVFDDNAGGDSPGGHGVCTKQPWIYGLTLQPDPNHPISPTSFHPTNDGQQWFNTLMVERLS